MNSTHFSSAPGSRLWSRTARLMLGGALAALISLTACGGNDDNNVDRGPSAIPVVGAKLNGLYWDGHESRLYFTDDKANAIKRWDSNQGITTFATLTPPPASGANLGQLTRGPDDALYTTRFGFGTDGTIVAVSRAGHATNLNGLDATRRRIGITTAPDGTLVDSGFIRGGTGSVSAVTMQGTRASERELVTGFDKPVGIAITGDQLFVSDQNTAQILVYSLAAVSARPATAGSGRLLATFAPHDGLDLMTATPDGRLFVGGSGGQLFLIEPNSTIKVLAKDWPGIRGLAYDAENRRLFAAVAAANDSSEPTIRILPVD